MISPLRYLLDSKGFKIRADGRWTREIQPSVSIWDSPWIHQYQEPNGECEMWHSLFFPKYNMVPSYCKDCWKVVVFVPTVEDLFNLYEIQHELEHPSKCGIEYRMTDERRYGGYFYNWGKENGLKCYEKVRAAVPDHMNVILKCSCSEYEIACGPPDEWEVTKEQEELENKFRRWVLTADQKHSAQRYMTAYIMLKWIHHAVHIGDQTYKAFTGGAPLTVTMKTYHDEVNHGEMAE